jgi:hypothetical protein
LEAFSVDDFLKIHELLGKQWIHQIIPLEVLTTFVRSDLR